VVRPSATALVIACVLAATPASADEREAGDVAKRVRFGGELEVAYWRGAITWHEQPDQLRLRTDALGVIGWRRIPLSLGLGYGFGEHLLVGVRFDVALDPRWSAKVVTLEGAVGPYVEILLPRARDVRPFVLLRAAVGGTRTFVRDGHDVDTFETRGRASLYPLVALGLGAHAFISDELSFDATVALEHRWNFRTGARAGSSSDIALEHARGLELHDTTLGVGLSLGLSRWF
jgi:hypothetical protein